MLHIARHALLPVSGLIRKLQTTRSQLNYKDRNKVAERMKSLKTRGETV